MVPSQLKLVEYFPIWIFPKFPNPIKLKNKYYWFFVYTHGYKLQVDYDHLLITILHCTALLKQPWFYNSSRSLLSPFLVTCICCSHR